jgi:hypothetical protein
LRRNWNNLQFGAFANFFFDNFAGYPKFKTG